LLAPLGLPRLGGHRERHSFPTRRSSDLVLWAGWPLLVRGWRSLVTRYLNMFTLIAIGIVTAWGYSVVATVAPGIFPDAYGDEGEDRKSTRLNSSHVKTSYAVFCSKKQRH